MSKSEHSKSDAPSKDGAVDADKRPYTAPSILWREPYEPITFGVSCAKQPGNPGCIPGPGSS